MDHEKQKRSINKIYGIKNREAKTTYKELLGNKKSKQAKQT